LASATLAQVRLSRKQLASLKYPAIYLRNGRVTILGLSASSAIGLLRIENGLEPSNALLLPWKQARLRHSQSIQLVLAAEEAAFVLSIGKSCETVLWRACRLRGRTVLLQAAAVYIPGREQIPRIAALSPDGQLAVIVTSEGILSLIIDGRRLALLSYTFDSFPFTKAILALRLDNSNDGGLFLTAVDDSSSIHTWQIFEGYVKLVCFAQSRFAAVRATITPQASSSAARVAFVDQEGNLGLGTMLLESNKASYRDLHSVVTGQTEVEMMCCSTTNYVASIGVTDGRRCLRIINSQSSLLTSGTEYNLSLE
jgi:hypothetical protein